MTTLKFNRRGRQKNEGTEGTTRREKKESVVFFPDYIHACMSSRTRDLTQSRLTGGILYLFTRIKIPHPGRKYLWVVKGDS